MANLVIVRHGESLANQLNTYTGWSDVPLTAAGRKQAQHVGRQIQATGIQFSHVQKFLIPTAVNNSVSFLHIDQITIHSYNIHYLPFQGMDPAGILRTISSKYKMKQTKFN